MIDLKDKQHINSITQDTDGNLVVSINKFGVFTSLFRSVFGYSAMIVFIGGIVALYHGLIIYSIIAFFAIIILASLAWLNANDNLKKRIFPIILKEHINNTNIDKDFNPFLIYFIPREDKLEVIDKNGDKYYFEVEHIVEKLPLYVVKIIIRAKKSENN